MRDRFSIFEANITVLLIEKVGSYGSTFRLALATSIKKLDFTMMVLSLPPNFPLPN